MTDTQTNGPLSDRQMQALSFTFAEHLYVIKRDIDELRRDHDVLAERIRVLSEK